MEILEFYLVELKRFPKLKQPNEKKRYIGKSKSH
jgi:hypothetical protein